MKRIIYITISTLLLLAACTKPSPAPAPAPEQYDRYIFFSHNVETRVTLVENAGDISTFGVVGFKYDFYAKDEDGNLVENTWDEYKNTTPDPNVFYDEVVNSDGTSTYDITPVETVQVSAGAQGTQTCTYAPLQGWSNTKKYAFFAFYPMEEDLDEGSRRVNIIDGGKPTTYTSTAPTPAIKYTMDATSADNLKASMVDVLTAAHKDQYWKSSTENSFINKQSDDFVLEFSHRLSSLEVSMKNSSSGTIKINSLVLTISGIKNVSTIIPLDGNAQIPTALEDPMTATFTINFEEDEKTIVADPTRIKDKLIFIPQDEDISIAMSIEYTDSYSESSLEKVITDLKTPLTEGCKHMLQLNFVDYNVYVMVVNEWENAPDVNHDFS